MSTCTIEKFHLLIRYVADVRHKYILVAVVIQALELLVEKCASTIEGGNHSASSILLRVFECVASGLLLEGIMTEH